MARDQNDLVEGSDAAVVPPVDPEQLTLDAPASVMDLLAEHVPLALLADLAEPGGPMSQVILESEGLPDDAWWEADETREKPSARPSADPA